MRWLFSKQKNQDFVLTAENPEVQKLRQQVDELNTCCCQLQHENMRLKELLSSIQQLVMPG